MCKKLGVAPGGYEDNDGVPAFLSKAMNAPHKQSVNNALNLLIDLGAMMPISNDLTTLGEYLASLSLHPRAGKMVIWSYILGCTRVACAMATGMSYRSPFTLPPPSMKEKAAKSMVELSNGYESDQFLMHILLEKKDKCNREKEFYNFCQNNFISITTLQAVSDCRKNINNNLKLLYDVCLSWEI
jgi:HrpA-like RNA helicase